MNNYDGSFRPVGSSDTFREAHRTSDVDLDAVSQHHTLGPGPNQAAPGNHEHRQYWETGDTKLSFNSGDGVNWVLAGAVVSRTGPTAALFDLFGTTYGAGDGSTTFKLPDPSNRTLRIATPGTTGGSDTVTLTEAQMPAHTHQMNHDHTATSNNNISGGLSSGVYQRSSTPGVNNASLIDDFVGVTGNSGNSQPVDITNRWFGLNMLIKT